MFLKVITLVLCFSLIECNKFHMLFYGMQPCTNSTTKDQIEITHDWSQGLFSGTLKLPTEIDNTIMLQLDIQNATESGDAYERYIQINTTLCEFVNSPLFTGAWKKITESVGVKQECPIPEGSYELKDFSISAKEAGLPAIYGKFKMVTEVIKDNNPYLCREMLFQSSNYIEKA